jgi:hypothetical protein
MFVGRDRGGYRAAVFYTLIGTAKLNGLDPRAYIAATIDRMASGYPSKLRDALRQWNFKMPDRQPPRRKLATWLSTDASYPPCRLKLVTPSGRAPQVAGARACWNKVEKRIAVIPCFRWAFQVFDRNLAETASLENV